MADKQFIGRVTVKETKFGELIKISFGAKDRELLEQTAKNGWNNLNLKKGKSGNYYLEVDTFEPRTEQTPGKQDKKQHIEDIKSDDVADDLPF